MCRWDGIGRFPIRIVGHGIASGNIGLLRPRIQFHPICESDLLKSHIGRAVLVGVPNYRNLLSGLNSVLTPTGLCQYSWTASGFDAPFLSAAFAVRSVYEDHYVRICPIENTDGTLHADGSCSVIHSPAVMRKCRVANNEETRCRRENRRSVDFHSILQRNGAVRGRAKGPVSGTKKLERPTEGPLRAPIYEISPMIPFWLVRAKPQHPAQYT